MSQLVRTGGRFETAADSFQTADGLFRLHALYQSTDALEVAVAAAGEFNGIDEAGLSIIVEQVPFVLYIISKSTSFLTELLKTDYSRFLWFIQ